MILVCALGILSIAASTARAQTDGGRKVPVRFTASASPTDPRPGEAVTITVKAAIDPGWHLYAPASAAPANTPATVSDITALGDWKPLGDTQDNTPPDVKFDPNFQAKVAFHLGSAQFSRSFRVPEKTTIGSPTVSVRYQTCDDKICLPPTTVDRCVRSGDHRRAVRRRGRRDRAVVLSGRRGCGPSGADNSLRLSAHSDNPCVVREAG
jgi:hypothetical protein